MDKNIAHFLVHIRAWSLIIKIREAQHSIADFTAFGSANIFSKKSQENINCFAIFCLFSYFSTLLTLTRSLANVPEAAAIELWYGMFVCFEQQPKLMTKTHKQYTFRVRKIFQKCYFVCLFVCNDIPDTRHVPTFFGLRPDYQEREYA